MDYDLESIEFKIPEHQNSSSSKPSSRLNVKGMLERYRRQTQKQQDQLCTLKTKLSQTYQKLKLQIQLNNQATETLTALQSQLQQQRSQGSKIKQVLHSVIENRKHMQRQLSQMKEQMKGMKEKEQMLEGEVKGLKEELEKEQKIKKEAVEELREFKEAFENRVKSVREENGRFENQKVRLERQVIEKESEVCRLREENKKLQYLYKENSNLLKQIEQLKGNTRIDSSQYRGITTSQTNQNVQLNLQDIPKQVGKWKKPPQSLSMSYIRNQNQVHQQQQVSRANRREFSKQASSAASWTKNTQKTTTTKPQQPPINPPSSILPNQSPLSIDQSLTIQLKKKQQLQSDLNKLTNIKKLAPYERKIIEQLERSLYEVNSHIAGLKRKIRHRY